MICTKGTAGSSFYVNALPDKTQPKYLTAAKSFVVGFIKFYFLLAQLL